MFLIPWFQMTEVVNLHPILLPSYSNFHWKIKISKFHWLCNGFERVLSLSSETHYELRDATEIFDKNSEKVTFKKNVYLIDVYYK